MDVETATTLGIWALGLSPVWGAAACHIWQCTIRPKLIPIEAIRKLADEMVAKYGPRAEDVAFIEEARAMHCSELFQQGIWRRVRRELWRRYNAGEWPGPGN